MNDNLDVHYEAFPGPMVRAIDTLLEYAKQKQSPNSKVEYEGDWEIIAKIVQLWSIFCPEEYKAFAASQKELKASQANALGTAREKGGAEVQHQLEVPYLVDYMIKSFFPLQRTQEKKFVSELARRVPMFKVPEKL